MTAQRFRLPSRWIRQYEATQVELHGEYSAANVQGFFGYHSTATWRRVSLACLLTPLAPILVMLLIDTVPLEPIENGAFGSPHVWLRNVITVTLFGMCICEQFRYHLPELALSRGRMLFIASVAALAGISFGFGMSVQFGFPFPFSLLACTPAWATTLTGMIFLFKRRRIFETEGLIKKTMQYQLVCACQIAMPVIYPVYNYLYKSMESHKQTAFVLLLPIIKIASKNWISRALPNSDDAIPEAVVFNVEIYHALFVSLCMGNTTSIRTVALLMSFDLLQAWLSFREVLEVVKVITPITDKLRVNNTRRPGYEMQDIVTLASRIIAADDAQKDQDKAQGKASGKPASPLLFGGMHTQGPRILPAYTTTDKSPSDARPPSPTSLLPTDLSALTDEESRLLVRHTQKLLFMTEYIVLIEYVEVIMPFMYSPINVDDSVSLWPFGLIAPPILAGVCAVGMFCLPNRAFYYFPANIDTVPKLKGNVSNVFLYALLELASLAAMSAVLWWKLRVSTAHQLAYVLENRCGNIQAKLFLWMFDVLQNDLIQLGTDYSLQFNWLKKHPAVST